MRAETALKQKQVSRRNPLRTIALVTLLLAAAPATHAASGDGRELLKEVVLSLHASSVNPPSLEKLATAGLRAAQEKSPCLRVMRKPAAMKLVCNGRSKQVAWPPITGRAVAELLGDTLAVIDDDGKVHASRAAWIARAVANSARDPYTAYLDPQTVAKLKTSQNSRLSTPGIELSPRDPTLIRETRPGSDAAREGLKEGDHILAVDGRDAGKMTYAELAARLTGPTGSTVKLDVRPTKDDGSLGPKKSVVLSRHLIPEPLVNADDLPGGAVFVRVSQFAPGVARMVAQEILERRPTKVVLDLRHNPGGLIQEGVALLDLFFSEGAIGGVRPRQGRPPEDFHAAHQPTDQSVKLVVLIDGGTASASELVSMVLKERGRATILGSSSIGKGSVQKVIRMPDGGVLRVTSAYYTGATGQPLPLMGVRPHRFLSPPSGRTVLEGGSAAHDSWVLSALDVLEGGLRVSERGGRRSFYGPMP